MESRNIYFDNGSTSFPKAPKVAETVCEFLQKGAFNINRGNYQGAYDKHPQIIITEYIYSLYDKCKSRLYIPQMIIHS